MKILILLVLVFFAVYIQYRFACPKNIVINFKSYLSSVSSLRSNYLDSRYFDKLSASGSKLLIDIAKLFTIPLLLSLLIGFNTPNPFYAILMCILLTIIPFYGKSNVS